MKLKINYLTYIYLLLALLSGLFKNAVALIIIIIFHELGHVIIIKLLKYPIISINIYPFGGVINIDKVINTKISHDLLIGIGGFIGQISLFILILMFKSYFTTYFYHLLMYYNMIILLLNMLVVYPFDGYHLLNYLLSYFFSFEKAYYISLIINLIQGLFIINIFIKYNTINIPLLLLLIYGIIILIKEQKNTFNKFYMERLYYNFYYRKTNYLKHNNKKYLKREILSFYLKNNKVLNEKDIIRKKAA